MMLKRYEDLKANVRYDNEYHSIRELVQPDYWDVRDVARVLIEAPDFIAATQEFVDRFTTYQRELGDYWAIPGEMMAARAGDCDDKAILLCSILRNYLPPNEVYCAVGLWTQGGKTDGHMWVITKGEGGQDRIVEATAHPSKPVRGKYTLEAIFNDQYTFATDVGLKEFDLQVVDRVLVR